MNQHSQVQCGVCNVGLCLTALLCLWLAISASARADAYDAGTGPRTQSLTTIANRHSESNTAIIVCGGQNGHSAGLQINGASVATLWRMTYHMLFPRAALAEQTKMDPVTPIPDKGPAWNISVSHNRALLSIETKW